MSWFRRWLSAVKKSAQKIRLVDRCLIIFMLLLMLQSAYDLLANTCDSTEKASIDIVLRTTSAAIFGYFLSANFIKSPSGKSDNARLTPAPPVQQALVYPPTPPMPTPLVYPSPYPPTLPDLLPAADDLSLTTDKELAEELAEEEEEREIGHQQIIIATMIGIFALSMLLFIRNFREISPAMLPVVSQMRDFVSGCVGFLLGSPVAGLDN